MKYILIKIKTYQLFDNKIAHCYHGYVTKQYRKYTFIGKSIFRQHSHDLESKLYLVMKQKHTLIHVIKKKYNICPKR